jgi:23S rRNA (pseudouridine1915-N3)-methyltransferase
MKLHFWSVGKTHETFVKEGVESFTKRINRYYPADWNLIPMPKNAGMLSEMDLKKREGEMILGFLQEEDYLVLLDEKGKAISSMELAGFLQTRANESARNIVFLIGGAYGVSDAVKKRANFTLSLSRMVFPHQLVRLMIAEQVYRACTIIRNEKYHHQ